METFIGNFRCCFPVKNQETYYIGLKFASSSIYLAGDISQ